MILVDRVETDTMEEQVDLDTLMELELYNFRLVDVVMVEPAAMRMLLVLEVPVVMQKVEMESPPRVTLRTEKGHDINAACGQLRLREKNRKIKDDSE